MITQSVIGNAFKTSLSNKTANLYFYNFTFASTRWLYWFHTRLTPTFHNKIAPRLCLHCSFTT